MGREISISELEPALPSVLLQPFQDHEGIILNPPAFGGVADSCQGVSDRIEIRRDMKAVKDKVVSGVADNNQIFRADLQAQALDELRASGSSRQSYYHSFPILNPSSLCPLNFSSCSRLVSVLVNPLILQPSADLPSGLSLRVEDRSKPLNLLADSTAFGIAPILPTRPRHIAFPRRG